MYFVLITMKCFAYTSVYFANTARLYMTLYVNIFNGSFIPNSFEGTYIIQ
jgi:hypothetical protein